MTILAPIKGIRPYPPYVKRIVSGEYDYKSKAEAYKKAPDYPDSFIHVFWPHIDFPKGTDPYADKVYQKGRENYERLKKKGYLMIEDTPTLYVYRQQVNGDDKIGIIGGGAIDDYFNNIIKKHEKTRSEKENDQINHIRATQLHAGPVMLFYQSVQKIEVILKKVMDDSPTYDFFTGNHPMAQDGKIRHTLWIVKDKQWCKRLQWLFERRVSSVYIADGHHRSAAAAKVGRQLRLKDKSPTGLEPYNFFLSIFFPTSALDIYPFNRVVHDLNGWSTSSFIKKLKQRFDVIPNGSEPYQPDRIHRFGMYLEGEWYALYPKTTLWEETDVIEVLDVTILQKNILAPLLGIKDLKTDKRIDFVEGMAGVQGLEKKIDEGEMQVGFVLYPVTINQLMQVADEGRTMPPKSTWIEPKLLSGLVVHSLTGNL